MSMSTRERAFEMGMESLLSRVNEMKTSLNNLILKIELDHENFSYPDALDMFAVISGQMHTVMQLLKSDKLPSLKELVAIPLLLNPDKDQELQTLTEGRLEFFNHAVVPDYLRTKPDPTVEKDHERVELRGSTMNSDAVNKQLINFNKMADHMLAIIDTNMRDFDASQERTAAPPTSSPADSLELVTSVYSGKAFRFPPPTAPMQRQGPPSASAASPQAQGQVKGPGGTIKTTIKPAGRNY